VGDVLKRKLANLTGYAVGVVATWANAFLLDE
jgi:hypothetical protein